MSKKTTYIIFALLACLALFCAYDLFSGGNNSVQGTINTIRDDNVRTGELVDSASSEVNGVANELGDVSNGLGSAAKTSHDIAAEISDSKSIVNRCIELNRQAKSILNDIERTNQNGTQTGKD